MNIQDFKLTNKTREVALRELKNDVECFMFLEKTTYNILNYREVIFPKSSHNVWFEHNNFDCILATVFYTKDTNYDFEIPILVKDLHNTVDCTSYEGFVKMCNHTYSVPAKVIAYAGINTAEWTNFNHGIEDGICKDFSLLCRDYIRKDFNIDPYLLF